MQPSFKIKKGLDIPLAGAPEQNIHDGPHVGSVALVGYDYHGYKRLPQVLVEEGESVRLGQPLARSKQFPNIVYTSPGTGIVEHIHRGERRFLQTISVRLEGDSEETFNAYGESELAGLNREQVKENLLASGMWLAFRTRPFSLVADPESAPFAIFVTAVDTNPLAPDPAVIIKEQRDAFLHGLAVVARLTDGHVYVCKAAGAEIPEGNTPSVIVAEFSGPHPAGLVGTHIHFLAPVGTDRIVWHLGYPDVISIGRLFTTGRLHVDRVIALAGPAVKRPRLIRTRLGANTNDLTSNELAPGESRVISGSILSGRRAAEPVAFHGRYHNQISVLSEGREREFLGWLAPGLQKFSAINVFLSSFFRNRQYALTTSQQGSERAMMPIGSYEQVMPLDILPTPLLRALLVHDTDSAQALGCLELDEEDLALCSFVCPSKYEFGPMLRANLEQIRKEG